MSESLYLLDGMALVYRAHFAFITRPIVTSAGRNVSAIFGFANTLMELIDSRQPSHLAVAFDTSAPTPRHELYPEYKAQREAMPEDLAEAIPDVKRLLQAWGIPVLEKDGAEADDIIGTLATQASAAGFDEVWMVTPDKDFAQLVDDTVNIYKPGRKGGAPELLGVKEVCAEWEVERPEQVIDVLGLMGDSSDNIPGVPGVGPKTAKKLIGQYGSVDALLEHTAEIKGKMREKLEANADMARLSRQLVVINREVELPLAPADLKPGERQDEQLQGMFEEWEFRSIAKRLLGDGVSAPAKASQGDLFEVESGKAAGMKGLADVEHDYRMLADAGAVAEQVALWRKGSRICFDLETSSLDPLEAEIVAVALSDAPGRGWMVPAMGEQGAACLEALRELWLDEKLEKVGHNLKFDLSVLFARGFEVEGPFLDGMILHYLIDPEQRHGMDALAAQKLGYAPIPITDLIGPKGKDQKSMKDVPMDQMLDYAVEDADITLQLVELLLPELEKSGQLEVFQKIEMPLIPVLARMELEGIRLDSSALEAISMQLGSRLQELETRVKELAGEDFNLNSPKQLGVILFEKLKIAEKVKKTKTGQYSTSEQTLQGFAGRHEIVDAILEFRELGKLKSTYVDSLPKQVHARDGRVHTKYMQTGAATGRLSSVDPNLQNIPIRTEQGRAIRGAFVPRGEGYVLMAADYSQIELRLMAHLSGDPGMKSAFQEGQDIHSATASRVYGVPLEEVSSEMRRKAKMVNFGIIYGISAFGLSQRLAIPREEAGEIIRAYFKQYPGVKNFMSQVVEETREQGWVETLGGRRRRIRDIDSRNATQRQAAERVAINSPIQGSAADMIKRAMCQVDAELRRRKLRSRLLLQVHDELVFDLWTEEQEEVETLVKQIMEEAMPLDLPLLVEVGTGKTWLEAH